MSKCDSYDCFLNDSGECEEYINVEDRYCKSYKKDESKCECCGAKLQPRYNETVDFLGRPVQEEWLMCPDCDG